MKKYIFTESQIKKIIDSQITEDRVEFRPGVDMGKSFEKFKKEKTDKEKEKTDDEVGKEKKPFTTNRLKSEKPKESKD
jgi:hypothetical protein